MRRCDLMHVATADELLLCELADGFQHREARLGAAFI